MSERELFDEVLKCFIDKYNFKVTRPYNNGYMVFTQGDVTIGEMNIDGRNLLANLAELTRILDDNLR